MTTASGLIYVNQINKQLLIRYPQFRRHSDPAPQEINVVAGTTEYNINTGGTIANEIITMVEYVELNYNATGYQKIQPNSIESLNRAIEDESTSKTWREASGQPTDYYIAVRSDGVYLGFNVAPAQNGVLRIWGSSQKDVVGADNLLFVLNEEVYIEGICYRHAKAKQEFNDAFMYLQAYEYELALLDGWVKTLAEGFQGDTRNVRG